MGIRDDIHEDAGISAAIASMLRDMGREETQFLDEGIEGYAARLDDGSVVKVTTGIYEVASALYLMETPDDGMAAVHAVCYASHGIYLIVREDIADLDVIESTRVMDDMMIETHLMWRTGRRNTAGFHSWMSSLDEAGNPMASILRELWMCMEHMESKNLHAGDINFSNMGRNATGTMVMRDLGGCNPPLASIRRANVMQPGDVLMKETAHHPAYSL